MKFGKSLSNQIGDTLPEWRDKFLSYKELKKCLKLIEPKVSRPAKRQRITASPAAGDGSATGAVIPVGASLTVSVLDEGMSKEEIDFIWLLERELEKFNSFFVEKEEEYIIRVKELQDRVAKAKAQDGEMLKIRKEIVDFHGEMVLLENYSALNYTGLVKILKKYDKRTGALMRLPFIQKVLQQPFFTTDLIYKLVKECERMLDLLQSAEEALLPTLEGEDLCGPTTSGATQGASSNNTTNTDDGQGQKELAEIEYIESLYLKSTISALRALKEIRSRSSTVSEFSLPPLQLNGMEETWKKIPILEQVAK